MIIGHTLIPAVLDYGTGDYGEGGDALLVKQFL